jgi:hypothetical protein
MFILDPLPSQGNGVRDDDAAKAGYLDEWHARDYAALGYDVVRDDERGERWNWNSVAESRSC